MRSPEPRTELLAAGAKPDHLREHAERDLGGIVIAIEFTLISVMVGVILFPLMDLAVPLLRDMRLEYWLYILSGLMFILYLWAQVISHSLSFIAWPINIGHNLLYIIFAMILAVQMHFLADPRGWFAMSLITSTAASILLVYDLRMIEGRMKAARGTAADLFAAAQGRQSGLVRLAPVNIGIAFLELALILAMPDFFIDRPGHLILVSIQIIGIAVFTAQSIVHFGQSTDLIVRKAIEELASEGEI